MNSSAEYIGTLINFVNKVQEDQQKIFPNAVVYYESGRKYDKIIIDDGIRYFILREDGSIYGAKSRFAPNLKWYFGILQNCEKWDWSGYHGKPVSDDTVIVAKGYRGKRHYEHYILIK